MNTVAVIQARLGSSRLPGKVLMDIVGAPMLMRVANRVRRAKAIDAVVIATSFEVQDQEIVRYCQANGVMVLRGGSGENDVLGRFVDVAQLMSADVIVRITADCPLLDASLLDDVVERREELGQPYLNNVDPVRTFPDGTDVEAFTFDALMEADAQTFAEEREHVTPFMRRQYPDNHLQSEVDYGHMKWSVDTQEELDFVREVYQNLGGDFGWKAVLEYQKALEAE